VKTADDEIELVSEETVMRVSDEVDEEHRHRCDYRYCAGGFSG
jgi:hypothetical protein